MEFKGTPKDVPCKAARKRESERVSDVSCICKNICIYIHIYNPSKSIQVSIILPGATSLTGLRPPVRQAKPPVRGASPPVRGASPPVRGGFAPPLCSSSIIIQYILTGQRAAHPGRQRFMSHTDPMWATTWYKRTRALDSLHISKCQEKTY